MARGYRPLEPGGIYHVTAHAVAEAVLFVTERDGLQFLDLLERAVGRFGWLCQAYCLLSTHFHLLLETPEANLSRGMHWLNGSYAQSFNRHHERSGHLLADRFGSVAVRSDSHLLELARYIALNPVRAGVCQRAQDWNWSSYAATIGLRPPPPFLDCEGALRRFSPRLDAAQRQLRSFVEGTSPFGDGV
jgi:putative transposase